MGLKMKGVHCVLDEFCRFLVKKLVKQNNKYRHSRLTAAISPQYTVLEKN